jgi:hypothetical protein
LAYAWQWDLKKCQAAMWGTLIPPFRGLAGGKTQKHLANTGENNFPPPPKNAGAFLKKTLREKNRLSACSI